MLLLSRIVGRIQNKIYMSRFKRKNVVFRRGAYITTKTVFEGNCILGRNSIAADSYIGKGTYISYNSSLNRSKIGRFCSIANDVKVISGQHPLAPFVSTSPVFYGKQMLDANLSYHICDDVKEHKFIDSEEKYIVEIGNDVWIGSNTLIMEGVKIGDGAVIAAGAVVIKDVLPFSIVGGVPAKLIKMRFSPSQIEFLLMVKWWNKDDAWLIKYSKFFDDIEQLIREINTI